MGNGFRLVLLDGDGAGNPAHSLLQQGGAHHHLLAFLQQGAEVGGKVRLAFAAVDDYALALGARRRRKLHVRGEGGTTQAHYTTELDLLYDGLGVFRDGGDEGVGGIDAFQPLIAFHSNFDVGAGAAGQIGPGGDGFHRTRHGRMDERTHETARLGNHLTHLHFVAHGHTGHGRGADVLGHGQVHGRGDGKRGDGAFPGNLVVVRMDTAQGECMLTHLQPPFWQLLLPL